MDKVNDFVHGRFQNVVRFLNEISSNGHKKVSLSLITPVFIVFCISLSFAGNLPEGGRIVAGSGSIKHSANTMTINQNTNKMIVNWKSFSIGKGNSVNFKQPSSSSIALNRVLGSDVSVIQGALNANGKVFLVNSNGILFSKTAQVNVGGLVASTLDISNEDFLSGKYHFNGASIASIVNQGKIKTAEGGAVALIAAKIENSGEISSPQGNVLMGAGNSVVLDLGGSVKISVDKGALNALIKQGGAIKADGGLIYLTAKAANELSKSVINNSGVIEASSISVNEKGEIYLVSDKEKGVVNVDGKISAKGGFVETSGAEVKIKDTANITAGKWLIDPRDFTIAPEGGDVTGLTLSNSLQSGDVTIQSSSGATEGNGDIFVKDDITWSSGHTLTLSAYRNIEILSTIDASQGSGGKVVLEYGQGSSDGTINGKEATYSFGLTGMGFIGKINLQAGQNFSTKLGSNGQTINYSVITSLGQEGDEDGDTTNSLQGLANTSISKRYGNYALGADIDASDTQNWNGGAGFSPIGPSFQNAFFGKLDGLGHTISNLYINRPSTDYIGLIGYGRSGVEVRNIGILDGNIEGHENVGLLFGKIDGAEKIQNDYVTGSVSGSSYVGGLVGNVFYTTISNSYANVDVSGSSKRVGGLVGYLYGSTIEESYSTGNVSGNLYVGGLVGDTMFNTIEESYSTGNVSGNSYVGGLVGYLYKTTIEESYSTGNVSGNSNVGGLVGYNYNSNINNSFWDTQTSGQGSSAGGTGKTTAEMKQLATFQDAGWDITSGDSADGVWGIYEGTSYPVLRALQNNLVIRANDYTKTYDGNAYSGGNGVEYLPASGSSVVSGTVAYSGTSQGAKNAGTYLITPSGLTLNRSTLQDYQSFRGIEFRSGVLTIEPKSLKITGTTVADKEYDGTTDATVTPGTLSGFVGSETVEINTVTGRFEDKNAGENKNVYVSYTLKDGLNGGLASNYKLDDEILTATINPRPVNLTGSRVYDGTNVVNADIFSLGNLVAGEDLNLTGQGTVAEKDVGNNKPVTLGSLALENGNNGLASNYTLQGGTHTATITKKPLTATYTASDKVYDGTTAATVTATSSDIISGDDISLTATGEFEDKNVGTDKSVNVSGTLSGADAGNYAFQNPTSTVKADITPKPLTATYTASDKVYDGTTAATVTATSSDIISGDDISLTATGEFEDKNVGTDKSVNVSGTLSGADAGNYAFQNPTDRVTATITPKPLTATYTASDKVYDRTTKADVTATSNDIISGDDVNLTATGEFEDKNVGTDKSVNVSGTLSGADAGNYAFQNPTSTVKADITPKPLTASYTAKDKVYDGTTKADVTATSNDIISGDDVNLTATGEFEDKNVGTGKSVNVSGTLSGADAGNYAFENPTSTVKADITPKPLTASYTAKDKVYDGTTKADVTATSNDIISGDDVNLTATGEFEDKNVGTGKSVNVSGTLSGADAGNYAFENPTSTVKADITPKPLTATYTAKDKVYDGTTKADVTATSNDIISGDDVNLTATGEFEDKNVGTGKSVNVSGTLSGTDAGNYAFENPTSTVKADITPKPLTATYTAKDKVYDGTTAATVTATSSDIISGDDISLTATGEFEDKNVGTDKSVNVSGTLSGADAGNYAFQNPTDRVTATITPKPLTATYTASDKVYDGTTAATVTATSSDIISGDDISLTATGEFEDKNVGTDKSVNVSGTLSGADAGNYAFQNPTDRVTATITPKPLTATYTASDKVYDGTTAATVTATSSDIINGDDISLTATGEFEDKNVGTDKSVNVSGTLSGADAGNYAFENPTSTVKADITPKPLTASYTAKDKVYDGTTAATVTATSSDIINGDDVALTATGEFEDKNVGTDKSVNVSGTLSGTDAGNYAFENPTSTVKADITPKPLTASYTASDKVYDGTTAATVTATSSDIINGDDVALTATGEFEDKNVGTDKSVNVSGTLSGTDAGNYAFENPTSTVKADITPKPLTASYTASDKVYDGTTAATVTATSSDIINGDDISLTATGEFEDKNVGTDKSVNVSGTLSGTDAGNYAFENPTSTVKADITPKPLTASYTASDKVYDGTTAATVTATSSDIINGDDISLTATGEFEDKNVGTDKSVNVSGTLSGTDAGNYAFENPTSTVKADITPKPLTASYTAKDKVYDGTTAATVTATSSDIISGDDVALTATGEFEDKNVGTDKSVNVSGTLSGADAGNYAFENPTSTVKADITPKPLTASYTAKDKVYDGTTAATVTATSNDIISGDDVALTATGEFEDKNVGTDKSVNVSGTLSGADAGNYAFQNPKDTTTATINRRPVLVVAVPKAKKQGEPDPALTYKIYCPTGISENCALVPGETLIGSLTREKGEDLGKYNILQGTITDNNNPNYDISYKDAQLTIVSNPIVDSSITVVHGESSNLTSLNTLSSSNARNTIKTLPNMMSKNRVASGDLIFVHVSGGAIKHIMASKSKGKGKGLTNLQHNDMSKSANYEPFGFVRVLVVDGGINIKRK